MVFLIILLVISSLLGFWKYRKIINPITAFSAIWAIVCFLYLLKLRNYYDISELTLITLFLQTIGFLAGSIIADIWPFRIKRKRAVGEYIIRKKLLYFVIIITIASLLYDTINVILNLFSGLSFYDLSNKGLLNENNTTGIMVIVKIFIVFPVEYSISCIGATSLFSREKNWFIIVSNLIIVALSSLQHGARHIILLFVLSYTAMFFLSNRYGHLEKKRKGMTVVFIVIAFLFSLWLSISRGISEILPSIYYYFSSSIPNLDHWINRIASEGTYTYGFTSLNGFFSPFFILLKGLGIISASPEIIQKAYQNVSSPEQITTIGYGETVNAFVGTSYSWFCDGGLLFVFLGMFIYGFVCMMIYKKAIQTKSIRYYSLYLLMFNSVFMSFSRFQFCNYFYSMALVLILVLFTRRKSTYDNFEP